MTLSSALLPVGCGVAFLQTGMAGRSPSPEIHGLRTEQPESHRIKDFLVLGWGWSGVPTAGGCLDEGDCGTICSAERFPAFQEHPSGLKGGFITTEIRDPVSAAIWGIEKLGGRSSPHMFYLSRFTDRAASFGWISEVRVLNLKLLFEVLFLFFPHPEKNHKYLQGPTKLAGGLAWI